MEKNKRIFSGKKRRKLKQGMGILLAIAVVLNTLPLGGLVVSASENKEVGICTHHKQHTKDCGYSPASDDRKGSLCTYECKLCPIEDLIAALPDAMTEDNAEEVRAQIDEILDLYWELTEEEQGQLDIAHCLELQEQLDVNIPYGVFDFSTSITASAEEAVTLPTTLQFGNINIIENGEVKNTSGETWNYDASTNTINITADTTVSHYTKCIYSDGDLNINVAEGVTLISTVTGNYPDYGAIESAGDMFIGGAGTIKAITAATTGLNYYGIYAGEKMHLSGITLNVECDKINPSIYEAIRTKAGELVIENAVVTAPNSCQSGKQSAPCPVKILGNSVVNINSAYYGLGGSEFTFSDQAHVIIKTSGTYIIGNYSYTPSRLFLTDEQTTDYYWRTNPDSAFKDGTTSSCAGTANYNYFEYIGAKHLKYTQNSDGETHKHYCTDECINAATVAENEACSGGTATCAEKAVCTVCEEEYGSLLPHSLQKTESKLPTCTEDGNSEYWYCSVCEKYFSDENGENEIQLADTVISANGHDLTHTEQKEATCTEDGNIEYYHCSICKQNFSDSAGKYKVSYTEISASGHQYGGWQSNGSENVGTCQACGDALTVEVDTAPLTYDGTAKEPDVTVRRGDAELTEGYTVSYTNNINAGDNASVTVTGTKFNGTFTQKFSIKKATPDIGKVTAQELENTLDISKVALKRENQTLDGTLKLIDGSTLQYGTNTYTWEFIPKDTMNYLPITGNVDITVKDTIPPTAKYQIGTDKWKEFVKTISFGLFCKDYKTVELEFTDDTDTVKGSGIAKKQYYISDKEITDFNNIEWMEYTKTIHLDAKGTYFIYVNVSDNAGNEVILNSEGIVIYEESALSPAAFDYTYKQNKDCTVQLTMNGNTFKTLTDNKGNVISTSNYTVENGKLTLKAAYLDTLDKGEYTYKIYMNPQDVETDKVTLVYTFTVKVKAKELTVTGATATDRDYNGTNVVGITEIALSGIAPDDDVSVDLNGIQGLLSSANAGEYDSVTLPKLTLKGTSKSNYTLVQPTKAVATSVTIEKAATEITVGTSTYNKTFGDGAFTLDVTDNNLEKDVQYKVTAGEDVVSVENGTVNIKSAGTATITVSLPASVNYKAATDKTITVDVAKKNGYTVEAVNKSYLYTKENADTIDLAALLPKDCGMVNYESPSTSGDVTFKTSAVDDGKLSYTLESGSASDEGTITVIATTQNYEDIKITVNVKLTDKVPVSIKEGMKVTLKNDTLNYGEALSKLEFDEVDFVDSEGNKVEGTLTWKKEETTPDAGTTSATWQFLPTNNSKYETLEGIAAITVNKAVPVVDAVPTVTERVYNPSVTLKNIDLTGGMVSVEGSWSWEHANIVPSVDNSGYVAVFTPTDKTNYETVTKTIVVKVTKATPYIKTAPSVAVITYGDALSVSNLAGGVVQYSNDNTVSGYDTTIMGSFAWKDDSQKPVVAGSKAYEVVFTPADGANYNSVEITVTPTVLKAENAPNMPNSTMNVLNSCKKVSDVTLPDGWEWQEADKDTDLEVGKEANAVAIYTGTDKGNYEKEMVTVAITRTSCDHVAGEILYTGTGEKAPTCTENGLGHRECTKCHSLIESEIVVTAFGHIHTEFRGTVGATCMADGYTGDSYCKDCGVKIADGTATGKLAHNYTSRITKEPTTTEEGVRTYTCMGCGNSYTDTISKLPEEEHKHSYSSQITKEPTCKEKGIATYSCSCGDSYTESIPALNHSYASEVTKEPTTTEEGVRTYTCIRCGNSYTDTISKLPEEEHKHSYSSQVTKEPTCKEEGIRTYSCSCGDSYTESIPVLNHSYTNWKSDETNHWHECSSCGDKKDTTIHTEDSGTVTKQPTETETGIRTYSCSVCQRELRTEIIDKLDHTHTYKAEWKSDEKNHWHECSSCGDKKDTTTHTEDSGTVTKQPTETETGIRTYSCSVCQRELRTETIDKLDHTHTYETEWKSDEKNHWHECSCGEKSEKSNHNFGAWVVVKQPTQEKEGMRKRDCTVCGYQQTEKIPMKEPDKNELALNAGLKVSQTGSQINIAWGKVSGASGYDVYVQYCGMKFSAKSSNQVKGGTKTKTTVKKVNGKKLDLKKSYKVYVVAYKLTGGKKVTISKSITAHIIGRNNKKYTNVKAVTVKKNSYILKKGKTAMIQAKTSLVSKGKKELPNSHTDKFRYASSNKKVATVSAKGKIKAIGKGSCIIYIYAKNGYAKKIKVTVK
ncbi:MAG: hypothetical protein HDT30_10115 [Clostridiales bacterium]|nr:hypothetical protein [Clostridiales bacterium]